MSEKCQLAKKKYNMSKYHMEDLHRAAYILSK